MATINRSQLKGKLLEVYDKIKERQKSDDPEIAEKAKKQEQEFVKKILEQVKKKKAEQEAEKDSGKAPAKKDKPKAKVAKKPAKKTAKKPAVKKATTPTRVGKKPFMTQVKELSDKEGISFKEARSKLSKQLAEEKKKSEQEAKKELENLLSIARSPVENKDLDYKPRKGNKASNPKKGAVKSAGSDAKRLAKPVGKRVSKNGKTYYEYRDNRSDRNSIPAPKGEYKYKGVTPPYLEMGGITDLSADSLDAITYAKGGKLSTHGLEIGDVIQKEIKYPSGEVNLVVKDKNGVRVFVDLEDGYRDVNPPLPFEKGGRIVKIVNEGEEFDEEKYQAIFGDYDGDGVANINDISPLDKSKRGRVEQIELDQTFRKLIDLKNNLDDKMYKALDKLDKKAPKNAEFYARTKTPFSIVKKLVDKRLLDPKKGLTDMIGTTVVVENQAELEKVKNDINKGLMGDVLDFDDFYKNPNNGYRAYHFIVEFEGMPIEIQLKTKMQKQLNEVSHEFYKKGNLDAKGLDEVSKMIMQADKGDKQALAKVKKLLANKTELASKISNKMAMGGTLPTNFGQAGLVGETGAMNEIDLFAMGGDLPQGVHQYFQQTYNPAFPTPHGYAKGGVVDLFEDYEKMPDKLSKVAEKYQEKYEDGDMDYEDTKRFQKEVEALGYTFDFGLDNEPFGLRKKGVALSSLKGYEEMDSDYFAKGGETEEKGKRLKSALMRDRKYFNKDESWERGYSKGKNRKGYKGYEEGGQIEMNL